MYKVKVTIPATSTHLGSGLNVLALALSLHTTVDLQIRSDDELRLYVEGDSADFIPTDFSNPALRAAMRLFQRFERAPAGLQVSVTNSIPARSGLGLQTALMVGGLVAANNLIDAGLSRDEIIRMAISLGLSRQRVITTIRGGLTICGDTDDDSLFYRNFEVVPLRVVALLPSLPHYRDAVQTLPENVALHDAIFNLGRLPLLVEALCNGDFSLLRHAVEDRLHLPHRTKHIPGFTAVQNAAYEHGALAVTLSGNGPIILAFAEEHHEEIAQAMVAAFQSVEVETKRWTLGVDRQGVVMTVFE